VDGNLKTSNPDVYAVGDVAAFPLLKYGVTTRQEHVTNARSSAIHAIASILDPATPPYDYLPFFYSRVYNLSWQVRAHSFPCRDCNYNPIISRGVYKLVLSGEAWTKLASLRRGCVQTSFLARRG
jgi:hypothetical protein